MPAKFSAFPPDRPALVRVLDEGKHYRVGRASDCELHIDHFSVSRLHAELVGGIDPTPAWTLHDTGSKNGLRVDGHLTLNASFKANAWFAIGDVYCQLELVDTRAAARLRAQNETRRTGSRELAARLSPRLDLGSLIPQTLDVVLKLSGLERGFVLYAAPGEPLRVHASHGIETEEFSKGSFNGSASAVDKALTTHAPVVCCDTADLPWLGLRPSVRLGGIRALVCLPLRMEDGASGAIYIDSRKPGPPVTELDMELLDSVAQHAAAVLAARRLQGEVEQLLHTADLDTQAPRWDEVRPL